jgi:flagellar biosynthesis/type III secretory pathway protein FliH
VPAADFIALDVWLRGAADVRAADAAPAPVPVEPVAEPPRCASDPPPEEMAALLRDVRRFRAALADALESATAALARELAFAVLGRELLLAPADVGAIARRMLAEHPAATPLEIRHAPGEAPDIDLPCVADPALAGGDLMLRLADGAIDARIGVRLAVALEAWS